MRLTEREGEDLLREGDLIALGREADKIRKERFGNTTTFIIDRNINYTNVCVNECRFCAFFRRQGSKDAYLLSHEEILEKVRETVEAGGTQVMIQGGLYPELGLAYYEKMLRLIKEAYPSITIHSFTATEIQHFAREAGLSILETLKRLQAAGLDSLPGGGAEILVDEVRRKVSPKKIMTDDWLHVMECAHSIGMESTATMVIGFGETMAQRIEHMEKVRRLQDKTGGFRAFIPWTFSPEKTRFAGVIKAGGAEYLKTLAICRLYLDNIPNLGSGWLTEGMSVAQLGLLCGANDLGGILMEEKVIESTGWRQRTNIDGLIEAIRGAGYLPARRDSAYRILETYDAP